jgi:hypothetical protein
MVANTGGSSGAGIAQSVQAGRPRHRGSSPGRVKIFSSPRGPDRLWGPSGLSYLVSTGGKVAKT